MVKIVEASVAATQEYSTSASSARGKAEGKQLQDLRVLKANYDRVCQKPKTSIWNVSLVCSKDPKS